MTQLSFVDLAYPGAKHSRFEHALGVMHLCGRFGEHLRVNQHINSEEVRLLRLAGLLHDIGHGPFSHAFEPTFAYQIRKDPEGWVDAHVRWGQQILQESRFGLAKVLTKHDDLRKISLLIGKGYSKSPVSKDVLTGPFSADRLDYLRRDAYHAGAPEYAIIDPERIIHGIYPFDNSVGYLAKATYALEGAILSYFFMYRALYYHHVARAANLLFDKACWLAFGSGGLKVNLDDPEFYFEFTDRKLLSLLLSLENRNEESKQLIRLLLMRRLPKRILDERDLTTYGDLWKKLSTTIQDHPTKHQIEAQIKGKIGHDVYIDTPYLIPYPPPGDDPTIIPNEQDPYKNYLLSSSSPTLTGLRGLGGYPIPRVYVPRDQIPEKALEMTKFKEKILNTIIQTLQQ
ncbi:MAG: HD domain-containing protein [Nitrososphaerales archaeon]